MRRAVLVALSLPVALAAVAIACGPKDFPDESLISSVRILASRSDLPYAKPGALVHSEVLAVDGRPVAAANAPMNVYWLPFLCVNPPNDAYYACFDAFLGSAALAMQYGATDGGTSSSNIVGAISAWDGGPEASVGPGLSLDDAGAGRGAGSLASIPPGVDISPYLIQGTRVVFHLPPDIVSSHPVVKGTTYPYGLAVVFNIACAGHVEVTPRNASNPDPEQIPFGCFDAQHQPVSADDYVIGYTEVFAFDALTNQNPIIGSFTFRNANVPIDGGVASLVSFPHCAGSKCPDNYAVTGIPDASWELDPQNTSLDGGTLHEEIWVDYYSSLGSLSDEAILVFDPALGRVQAPHQEDLTGVDAAAGGTLWAVAHDNRGGANWVTIPLRAQ